MNKPSQIIDRLLLDAQNDIQELLSRRDSLTLDLETMIDQRLADVRDQVRDELESKEE